MKNSERMRCIYACDLWVSPLTDQQKLKNCYKLVQTFYFLFFYFFTYLCMCVNDELCIYLCGVRVYVFLCFLPRRCGAIVP